MTGTDKMNKHTPFKPPASLLERANEIYNFGAELRRPSRDVPVRPSVTEPAACRRRSTRT
jgi:hypothetical protein